MPPSPTSDYARQRPSCCGGRAVCSLAATRGLRAAGFPQPSSPPATPLCAPPHDSLLAILCAVFQADPPRLLHPLPFSLLAPVQKTLCTSRRSTSPFAFALHQPCWCFGFSLRKRHAALCDCLRSLRRTPDLMSRAAAAWLSSNAMPLCLRLGRATHPSVDCLGSGRSPQALLAVLALLIRLLSGTYASRLYTSQLPTPLVSIFYFSTKSLAASVPRPCHLGLRNSVDLSWETDLSQSEPRRLRPAKAEIAR